SSCATTSGATVAAARAALRAVKMRILIGRLALEVVSDGCSIMRWRGAYNCGSTCEPAAHRPPRRPPLAQAPERRRRIFALALPIIGGMLSQSVMNLVDTAMVGILGAEALAAVGLGGFASWMSASFI